MSSATKWIPLFLLLAASLLASPISESPSPAASFQTPLWQQAGMSGLSPMINFHTAGVIGPVAFGFETLNLNKYSAAEWIVAAFFLVMDSQPVAWEIRAEEAFRRMGR